MTDQHLKMVDIFQSLIAKAADLERPRETNTPKKNKMAMKAWIDANHMRRAAEAARALSEAIKDKSIPADLAAIKTKAKLLDFTRTSLVSNGYYHIGDSGAYADQSPLAIRLREWLASRGNFKAQEAEQKAKADIAEAENAVKFQSISGFFPTPPEVAAQMIELLDLKPVDPVLEPSAGIGTLMEAVRAACPTITVAGFEINSALALVCEKKGLSVEVKDFLEVSPEDRESYGTKKIVMNPPFEDGADMAHVMHAYKFLRPGGRLVSVMSKGAFFRSDRKSLIFRDWFSQVNGYDIDLPEDAFKKAFRSTSVRTCLAVIDKQW